jgi:hypothetical protein
MEKGEDTVSVCYWAAGWFLFWAGLGPGHGPSWAAGFLFLFFFVLFLFLFSVFLFLS